LIEITMHQVFSAHLLAENYNNEPNETITDDFTSDEHTKIKNKCILKSNHQSMMPRVREGFLTRGTATKLAGKKNGSPKAPVLKQT